ncbi:MAG TPA: tail fiber domain-containing protein, partial [Puia sp.]|nr:tail fiber domain-containing protein [Puia sp.]
SMLSNFNGNNNTAMGYISLNANQDGNNNTAIGSGAMSVNTHGSNNTSVGFQALQNNLTGSNNTALGYTAGSNLNSGDNNIIIGNNAQPSAANVSNEVTVGSASNNSYRMYAASWTNASDKKLKHDIKQVPVGLDFILGLKPVEFVYNNANNETKSLGFIAQDVKEDMQKNKLDKTYGLVNNLDEKNLGLNTGELIPILAKAIQEQQKIIEEQNKRIKKLEKLLLKK